MGVKIGKKELKLGIKSSSTCQVILEDVVVSKESILGTPGKGYKYAIECLNEGRIGIAAQMIGLAQGAYDAAMPYMYQRTQFGQQIGNFQVRIPSRSSTSDAIGNAIPICPNCNGN